jgi:hypothetical protein
MKKLIAVSLAVLLLGSGQAFALQVSSDGNRGDANKIYTAVFNNSGAALTSGSVVIWDTAAGTNANNLGAYVTTTTATDSNLAAGVVHSDSIPNGGVGTAQIYGARRVLTANSTDRPTSAGTAVGTSAVAGNAGSGTGLGVLLRTSGSGVNGELEWIFINPSNGE